MWELASTPGSRTRQTQTSIYTPLSSVSLPSRLVGIGTAKPLAEALGRLVITRQHGNAASYSYGTRRRQPQRAPVISNSHMTRGRLVVRRLGRGEFHLPACPVQKPWEGQPAWPASLSAAVSMRKYGWPGSPGETWTGPGQPRDAGAYLSSINKVLSPPLFSTAISIIDRPGGSPLEKRLGENNEMK